MLCCHWKKTVKYLRTSEDTDYKETRLHMERLAEERAKEQEVKDIKLKISENVFVKNVRISDAERKDFLWLGGF